MSRYEGGRSPDVRQSLKDVALRVPIAERRVGPQPVAPLLVLFPDTEQPVRRVILQRTQHDAVQDGENDRGSADAQPQSQHRNKREQRRALQRPQRITEVLEDGVHHSFLNAIIGSTRAARRAGSHVAASATSASSAVTVTKVNGSVGRTSYSWPARNRVNASAPTSPSTTPIATRRSPWPSTMPNRWNASEPLKTSSIVRTRPTGTNGSVSRITRASAAWTTAASPLVRTTTCVANQLPNSRVSAAGVCADGMKTVAGGGRPTNDRTSRTMPTTCRGCPSTDTVRPRGAGSARTRRANDSLTMTTGGAPAASAAVKSRPSITGVPSVRKNPGVMLR